MNATCLSLSTPQTVVGHAGGEVVDGPLSVDACPISQIESILRGNFLSFDKIKTWVPLRSKLLVFVSSTFTDTSRERNVLLVSILPDLRARGNKFGIDVTMVDMRWGVRDENTIDHRTWDECVRELDRCYSDSAGLFFLSLQADKYGYIPLPRTIDQDTLDQRMLSMSVEELSLTRSWYRLDENAIPPRYVLRNLKDLRDPDYWEIALPILRKELDGIVFDRRHYPLLRIGQSVTHWEAVTGLERVKIAGRSATKLFIWSHRHFSDDVTLELDPSMYLRHCLSCLSLLCLVISCRATFA
jgi:hypothetical protein